MMFLSKLKLTITLYLFFNILTSSHIMNLEIKMFKCYYSNKMVKVFKQIISCMGVVIYINKTIYVAVLKDKDNNLLLPKGHLNNGESYIEAAIREVLEETQIKLNKELDF